MAEKKHSNLLVLDILTEYSDADHILSVKDIQKILKEEYGIDLERRTIYSNLGILQQEGYEISTYNENGRGYYLAERQFEKGEVLLLCNAIHASHFISQKQSNKIIKTLLKTQSKYDAKEFTDNVYMPNPKKTLNKDMMVNVETISEAIQKHRVLQFTYLKYDKDKNLVPRRDEPYIVEPRYIVYADSRAYMIVTSPKHKDYTHYRIDRMSDLKILDEKVRPLKKNKDPYEYAQNKLFMFTGDIETVTFRCKNDVLDQMIDVFGTDIGISGNDKDTFTFTVKAPRTGALYLAQQYMDSIEITAPQSLREEFKENLKQAVKKYKN